MSWKPENIARGKRLKLFIDRYCIPIELVLDVLEVSIRVLFMKIDGMRKITPFDLAVLNHAFGINPFWLLFGEKWPTTECDMGEWEIRDMIKKFDKI